jgi:hypothetical protein
MLTNDELWQLCHLVVTNLISRRDWRLLAGDEYLRTVFKRAAAEAAHTEAHVRQIALNEYVQALYAACQVETRATDPDRQERAYQELGRYLYDHARRLRAGSSEADVKDAVQDALQSIYEGIQARRVKEPGAFLKYAFYKLRGALTGHDRRSKIGGNEPLSWDTLTAGSIESEAGGEREPPLQTEPDPSPEMVAEWRQLLDAVVEELRHKFKLHPRADEQLRAAILRYAFARDHDEIAAALRPASADGMAALISRGKDKLQSNQALEELYSQWFSLHLRSNRR